MNAVGNKIPNVIDLFKKTNYDTKIYNIESKCFDTSDFNKFMGEIRDIKIKEKRLVNKSAIARFIDKAVLNKKLVTQAIKA